MDAIYSEEDTKALLLAKLFGGDKESIPYRPRVAMIVGGVSNAILFQQIVYRWNGNEQKPFYKFKEPCAHHLYKEGDSWLEELGFSRREFDNGIAEIGIKKTKDVTLKDAIEQCKEQRKPVIYWITPGRVTFYTIVLDAMYAVLSAAYDMPLKYDLHVTKSAEVTLDLKPEIDFTRSEKENT